jgi:hypothetical protein
MQVSVVSRVVPPTEIQDSAIHHLPSLPRSQIFLLFITQRPKVHGTLAKLHTGCVNYDPTCTYDRGDVFIGNASLSVMCGIFALLHKLRLALVSDNSSLRGVRPVVYCKFVSSGRCVAYHDAVHDTTRRHILRATRLLLALLYGKVSLK